MPQDSNIPTHPKDMSPPWLAERLGDESDALIDFSYEAIGTGQVGDSWRLSLNWKGSKSSATLPNTIVAKCPSQNPQSREAGVMTNTYLVEANWYQNLSDEATVRCPKCYYVEQNAESPAEFALLLEDCSFARQGDQIKGTGVDQVFSACVEGARLHQQLWQNPFIYSAPWLNLSRREEYTAFIDSLFESIFNGWIERYNGFVNDDTRELAERLYANGRAEPDDTEPQCAIHGDLRLDNILFATKSERCVVLDWQTVSRGQPLHDIAYLLGTSFQDHSTRRQNEKHLIEEYLSVLRLEGKIDYKFDDAWLAYRKAAPAGLTMAIFASMFVEQTPRGDEMFRAMAERSAQLSLDVEALDVLPKGSK